MWVSKVIIHKNESTELVDYVLKIFLNYFIFHNIIIEITEVIII